MFLRRPTDVARDVIDLDEAKCLVALNAVPVRTPDAAIVAAAARHALDAIFVDRILFL